MFASFLPSLRMLVLLTVLTGVAYPLVTWGIAQLAFPRAANGSLIQQNGKAVGSALLGQPFVRDPEVTVEKLLAKSGAKVHGYVRYEVGAGIEKKQENFAAEVMAAVRGG